MRLANPRSQAKARKDLDQAAALVSALAELRPEDLTDSWHELLGRGRSWRRKAARGLKQLPDESRQILADLVPEDFRDEILVDQARERRR
jgi:hypothetical protein